MKMFFAAAVILILTKPLLAQSNPVSLGRLEVSAVYSYVRANAENSTGTYNLNGGSASLTYHLSNRFAAIGEFGAYHFGGSLPARLSSTMYTYLFGPRLAFPRVRGLEPFAQSLFGGGRLNASSGGVSAGENGFSMAAGGGVDVPLHSHFSIRAAEVEYLMTRFPSASGASAMQNDVRISAGVTYSFASRPPR